MGYRAAGTSMHNHRRGGADTPSWYACPCSCSDSVFGHCRVLSSQEGMYTGEKMPGGLCSKSTNLCSLVSEGLTLSPGVTHGPRMLSWHAHLPADEVRELPVLENHTA